MKEQYSFSCNKLAVTISGITGYLEVVDSNLIVAGFGQLTLEIINMVVTINGPVLGNDFNIGVNAKELILDLSVAPQDPSLHVSPISASIRKITRKNNYLFI